jgi:hypothetical protein
MDGKDSSALPKVPKMKTAVLHSRSKPVLSLLTRFHCAGLMALAALLLPECSQAQFTLDKTINTLWEQLDAPATTGPVPIILSNIDTNAPVPSDGSSVMTVLTGLKRYDATRLLLGIRDNGINETVAHNTNLANQFPDRSLQWLDAATGAPMGTALVINYAALGYNIAGSDKGVTEFNLQNMAFGVDAAGVVYVGVANQIIRYAPAANGTNFLTPTVAFDAYASGKSMDPNLLFANFRISGSGVNCVILAANKDSFGDDGEWYLTTADGTNFQLAGVGFMEYPSGNSFGGGNSSIVADPDDPSDNLIYDTGFPSIGEGVESTIVRRSQSGGTGAFAVDSWSPQQISPSAITNSAGVVYRTYFLTDVQTLPGLGYVVADSTPSYNTFTTSYPPDPLYYNGGTGAVPAALQGNSPTPQTYQPGWLAIHDQTTGNVLGLHMLNATEALTLIPGYPAPAPHADLTMGYYQDGIPQGGIEMYPAAGADAEILWWSTTYGIGRYTIATGVTSTNGAVGVVAAITASGAGRSISFSAPSGLSTQILFATNLPSTNWVSLGVATETPPGSGNYQFLDTSAPDRAGFYQVR